MTEKIDVLDPYVFWRKLRKAKKICKSKRWYASEEEAKKHRTRHKSGVLVETVYPCEICGGWHIKEVGILKQIYARVK